MGNDAVTPLVRPQTKARLNRSTAGHMCTRYVDSRHACPASLYETCEAQALSTHVHVGGGAHLHTSTRGDALEGRLQESGYQDGRRPGKGENDDPTSLPALLPQPLGVEQQAMHGGTLGKVGIVVLDYIRRRRRSPRPYHYH